MSHDPSQLIIIHFIILITLYHYVKNGYVICDDMQKYNTERPLLVIFFNHIVSFAITCILFWIGYNVIDEYVSTNYVM
jgi:hypothetical protein